MSEKNEKSRRLVGLFIAVVAAARIAHGFFLSITGPTLPSLAYNTNVSVGEVSYVFTFRGIGNIVGAIFAGLVFPIIPTGKLKLATIGVTLTFNGLAMAVMPLVNELWMLGTIALLTSLTSSYFNTGLESLILNIWGPKNSAWVIQIYHAFFTIGGFLAPFLVQLFKSSDPLKNCGEDDNVAENSTSNGDSYWDSLDLDIIPPYLIVGGFVILCGIFTLICAFKELTERLMVEKEGDVDNRKEKPVKRLLIFFSITMLIHACCANADTIFQSYIYYYALCSETFDWDAVDANMVNMAFWIAFIVGRFSGTYISTKISAWILILIYFMGSAVGVSIIIGLDVMQNNSEIALYIAVIIVGFFVSCVYGSSTTMCNSYTNMGLRYVFINNLGASIGTMVGPQVTGLFVEANPIVFCYSVLVVCIVGILSAGFVYLEGNRILHQRSYKETLFRHSRKDTDQITRDTETSPEDFF